MASVWDVLTKNITARFLYERLLFWGISREQAQNVVVLLLWFQMAIGIPNDIIDNAATLRDNNRMGNIIMEADAIMRYLYDGNRLTVSVAGIPTIANMCMCRPGLIDYRFFRFHRELVLRGIYSIRNGVAAVIFNETYQVLKSHYWAGLLGNTVPPELAAVHLSSVMAELEDFRSVFITFSQGCPISEEAIFEFFTKENNGEDCIERIIMETDVLEGETPKHGLVVFNTINSKEDAMSGKMTKYFYINGIVMAAHMYQPVI